MRGGLERAQRNLYVLNLPLDATTDQFEALFAQHGSVEHAVILATLDHLARRRGFILMADAAQARAAIDSLNGHVWHHYRIEVSFAIVQRSGTPFSQDTAVDSAHRQSPLQLAQTETFSQPNKQNEADEPPAALDQEVHCGVHHRNSEDSTLLISGLDTSVITSPSMVRALTEPFGHVVELSPLQQRREARFDSHVMARYCCPSSAALARLALDGLVIGRSRVQASLRSSPTSIAAETRDIQMAHTSVPIPRQSRQSVAPAAPLRSEVTSPFCTQLAETTATASSDVRQRDLDLSHPHEGADPRGTADVVLGSDLWYSTSAFSGMTSKHTIEDPPFGQRRQPPRPIGDERQQTLLRKENQS